MALLPESGFEFTHIWVGLSKISLHIFKPEHGGNYGLEHAKERNGKEKA